MGRHEHVGGTDVRGPARSAVEDRRHAAAALSILAVEDVSIRFGGLVAIDDLTMAVDEHQICSVIGPNGAGKTTLLNCLSRLYQPASGRITFDGVDLLARKPHELAGLGIARTFQNLALFPQMTVLDNAMTGGHSSSRGGFVTTALRLPGARSSERAVRRRAGELLERLGIAHLANRRVQDLPYGTQKRVEIARALASEPRLLLLDEPAAGLIASEVDLLAGEVSALRDALGLTVVLVEHHMRMVMRISDKVVVLESGARIAEGAPAEVANAPEVIAAYLGVGA
jgi:branched-chain amino acid transport system ATP-binding protein